MPKYDFRCPACGATFEIHPSLDEATAPVHCPHETTSAERVFTMPRSFVPGGTRAGEGAPNALPGSLDEPHR